MDATKTGKIWRKKVYLNRRYAFLRIYRFVFLVAHSQSFTPLHPYRILSSLPNLIRNELNDVPREHFQISLSISRDNEKSRSPGCITLAIINGDVGEQNLDGVVVENDAPLKLFRQIKIVFQ